MTEHSIQGADDSTATSAVEIGDAATVEVDNIGGIDHCDLSLTSGVTLLTGQNATNRTSFLQALNGVLGGDMVTLRSECDSGEVQLSTNGETFHIQLKQGSSGIIVDGTPVTESADFIDRFVTLTRSNPIRQTVLNEGELRDLLIGPGEVRIQEQKKSLKQKRENIQQQIVDTEQELEATKEEVDDLHESEDELQELRDKYSTVQTRLASIQDEIDDVEETIEDSPDLSNSNLQRIINELNESNEKLDKLEQQRNQQQARLQQKQAQYEDLQSDLENVESDIQELNQELDSIETADTQIDSRIDSLQTRRANLQEQVNALAGIIDFNRTQLTTDIEELSDIERERGPLSELDPQSQTIECWTCGSQVERSDIKERIATLDTLEDELWDELDSVTDELEHLRERREAISTKQNRDTELRNRRDQIEKRIAVLKEEIEDHEDTIDELDESISTLEADLVQLEKQLETTEGSTKETVLNAHARKSELERNRGQLEQQRTELESQIERLEADLQRRDGLISEQKDIESTLTDLREQEEQLRSEIAECKNQLNRLERDTVEQFNQHMDAILERLNFENIARIRLERYTHDSHESSFELKIARTSETGTVYEDTIQTLSESERETIGLVVALAGYLVHGVSSEAPFILLDAVEPIDGDRINSLIEYFSQYSKYLIAAVLPEDEQVLADEYTRIPADSI